MAVRSEAAQEHNRALHRESYHWYKSRGICPYCKTSTADPGKVYCKLCYKKHRFRQEVNDPGAVRRKSYYIERRARLKEAGLCVDCGKARATDGTTRCEKCRKKERESNQKYRIIQRFEREAKEARER